MGPEPVFTTDWHTLDNPPKDADRPIMVYWESDGGSCFLEADFSFQDGKFYDQDYNPVTWQPDVTKFLWAYWPNPK